ncbi:MAG: DUF4396 domain-containing protein [Gammaproteobacteria bacterium]|nr:DUF4396 domain-containing protein [Gammaproteobacteria bacterium]
MEFVQNIQQGMSSSVFLVTWAVLALLSLGWLLYELRTQNPNTMGMMKAVWILTVMYSGPIGLLIYYYSGRSQIRRDSIWRKGFRSVAHCYSGCGAGEITGLLIAVGIMTLGNVGIALMTLSFAYLFGFAMTMGPLMQSGVGFKTALLDTVYSETLTIGVMEAVAISVDLYLSAGAQIWDTLFWSSLIVSLSLGLLAAYPVNVALIKLGVKEGMGDPRDPHHHH